MEHGVRRAEQATEDDEQRERQRATERDGAAATSPVVHRRALSPQGTARNSASPATPTPAPAARISRPSRVLGLTALIPPPRPAGRRSGAPARETRPRPRRAAPRRSQATSFR